MTRIVVGPFNRVEGDLEVRLDVDDGVVTAAYVNSPLFRGFENLLVGRAPADALVMVPRICGICSVAQSAAAAAALADAAGLLVAPNGLRAQQLTQSVENLADHLSHFYLFFMPDFTRRAYAERTWFGAASERFTAMRGSAAAEVLPARANFLKLMGFLAGKWPHSLALQPGGSTRAITSGERIRLLALLREFRAFLEKTVFGDQLEAFAAIDGLDALRQWAAGRQADFPRFLHIADDLNLLQVGAGSDNYLSHGWGELFAAGTWQPGAETQAFDSHRVSEDNHSAWLAGGGPQAPANGQTIVDIDKADAYTWCKAPRYDGAVYEVGALARQLVTGNALARDIVGQHRGSIAARVIARFIEFARVLPAMENWVRDIEPGEPFCNRSEFPDEADGIGLIEAARGSLGHWLSIRRGRIARFQIIAPTTWNFSPRDSQAQPGPLELALTGLPVGDKAEPLIQHVVRSFDPCMVCTVH